MPGLVVDLDRLAFVVRLDLHQHVTREELALAAPFLAATHFDDFLGRHQHFAELFFHAGARNALFQRATDRVLETGIGVNHIPTLAHAGPLASQLQQMVEYHPFQHYVDHPEQCTQDDDDDDDDQRRAQGLFAGWPYDLAQLELRLGQIFADHASLCRDCGDRAGGDQPGQHYASASPARPCAEIVI